MPSWAVTSGFLSKNLRLSELEDTMIGDPRETKTGPRAPLPSSPCPTCPHCCLPLLIGKKKKIFIAQFLFFQRTGGMCTHVHNKSPTCIVIGM